MQGGSAGAHAHARTAALAQTFVWHSHYGGLPHAGIFEHNIFDFAARNILAAAHNNVLLAAGDADVAAL